MSMYSKKGNLSREAGWFEGANDGGATVCGGMRQCVHCGGHFPGPTSEKLVTAFVTQEQARLLGLLQLPVRGWCMRCGGYICGPACAECIPVEQRLENIEKGRKETYNPVMETMPCDVSPGGILIGN